MSQVSPDAVSLVSSKPDDTVASGFQLHIQTVLDNESMAEILNIAQKHNLAVKEQNGKLVIYQPRTEEKISTESN